MVDLKSHLEVDKDLIGSTHLNIAHSLDCLPWHVLVHHIHHHV